MSSKKQTDEVREVWLGHMVTEGLSSLSIRWGKKISLITPHQFIIVYCIDKADSTMTIKKLSNLTFLWIISREMTTLEFTPVTARDNYYISGQSNSV